MAKKTILLVDDEKIIRDSLTINLQQDDFDIVCASSGEEAMAILRERQIAVIVTDLVMKEMDGIQVLREAKHLDPNIAVFILTGYLNLATEANALFLGAEGILRKPCDMDELLLSIRRSL